MIGEGCPRHQCSSYAEGADGGARRDTALDLVRRLPQERAVLPVQVLGELFNVLIRKAGRSRSEARDSILAWRDAFPLVETSPDVMLATDPG
jgi:predicted nucleic acid-binding protein